MTTRTKVPPPSFDRRLAVLRGLRGAGVPSFTERIRELVVVASSSRGGSSMFTDLLRESSDLLHLRAEINPFLRLAGLDHPVAGDDDRLEPRHWQGLSRRRRRLLDEELALDAGTPAARVDDGAHLLDVAWRLAVQWPAVDFDPERVVRAGRRVLDRVRRESGWDAGELRDGRRFQWELLHDLAADGYAVDHRYYDLPGTDAVRPPRGAPGDRLVEEPPFVALRAWRRADERDCDTKPLVVKTPSNAYRLAFLRAMFPNARLRVVHLTRNPAASINGLFDGWRHPGFHAHRMTEPLRIAGYSDECPLDRWWWKFDLPPGWRQHTGSPLTTVCAFQWRSAHDAVLDAVRDDGINSVQVRYEDLVSGAESRTRCVARLCDWLGIPFDGTFARAVRDGLDPVVTTKPPSPGRWRRRAEAINEVLAGDVLRTAERLGYGGDPAHWI